jgi:hypothetical protein
MLDDGLIQATDLNGVFACTDMQAGRTQILPLICVIFSSFMALFLFWSGVAHAVAVAETDHRFKMK